MKKVIVAIFLVILAVSSFAALAAPKAKADINSVQVLSYSSYVFPGTDVSTGDFIIVGEVQNFGTTIVDQVVVHCIVMTADDGVARADTQTSAFAMYLAPMQKAPFYIDIYANNSYSGEMAWDTLATQVAVFITSANDTTTKQYSGLTTNGEYASTIDGVYTVNGNIKNTGDQTSGPFRLITTFYNDTGTVIAVNVTDVLGDSLAPGQSVPFKVTPADHSEITDNITSYSLLVQAEGPLSNTSPSTSQSPNSTSTENPSPQTSQSSEPHQNSPSTELVYAIVGAVVIAGLVVVGLLLWQRHKNSTSTAKPISNPTSTS